MRKFAGVTLDFYDDGGEMLKKRFPTLEDLPDVIKTANTKKSPSEIPDEQFALVMIDGGSLLRKYACTDPGTTSMSVMYFMEHGHKLPEMAQKTAARNLFDACVEHKLLPPERLSKMASIGKEIAKGVVGGGLAGAGLGAMAADEGDRLGGALRGAGVGALGGGVGRGLAEGGFQAGLSRSARTGGLEGAGRLAAGAGAGSAAGLSGLVGAYLAGKTKKDRGNVVDVTGKTPKTKSAARPLLDSEYALITTEGERLFPIHDYNHLKTACDYWSQESVRMDPKVRRDFAVKVAAKAREVGFYIPDHKLLDAGSPTYGSEERTKVAFDLRKMALKNQMALSGTEQPEFPPEFLDELIQKKAETHPEVFAECVRRFDILNQLDGGWGSVFPDPYRTTFGLEKTAEVIWENGADRVTDDDLRNLAIQHSGEVGEVFGTDLADDFMRDPEKLFKSLPDPQKRVMARLATDVARGGGSESPLVSDYEKSASDASRFFSTR